MEQAFLACSFIFPAQYPSLFPREKMKGLFGYHFSACQSWKKPPPFGRELLLLSLSQIKPNGR
jgi:hypothetical protein